MAKTRIIMDSGKEYIYEGSVDDVKRRCVRAINNGTAEIFINGFINIAPNISINPSHISSLEEFTV